MPEDTDESELGAGPTAVTAVVPDQRNKLSTQEVSVPDPAWAEGSLPPPPVATLDATFPSMALPPSPPSQKARMFFRSFVHEFRKLPSRTRAAIIAVSAALFGLIVGLLIAPSGGSSAAGAFAKPDEDLIAHAQRMTLAERDAVVRSLSVADTTAALMMLRAMGTKDHVAQDPLAQLLRARLALVAKDGTDALDNFESALTANPKLAEQEPWLASAVVQTFAANKPTRTNGLLARLPKADAQAALERACMDWQGRVRRPAQDALKALGGACPDVVGSLMLDAYQAEKCDAARAVVQKLVPLAPTDERVGAALDAISRRPPVAGCVAELLPRR
ncbi:MAG: hypothetical protein JNK82_18715 [Myxococcaceae bacterium]|nr:hypothetical protein [Myxococcaceae bacterium]